MSRFLRIKEWWNSKIVVLFGLIYLFLIFTNSSLTPSLTKLAFLAFWMILAASFGYYINDVFDLPQDQIAQKPNQTKAQNNFIKVVISLLIVGLIGANWYFLSRDTFVGYLIIAQITLFFLYSITGIRLKEKPVIGVVTDALYAHLIPGLIVFYTIVSAEERATPILVVFSFWLFSVGVRNILNHHLVDFTNDMQSSTTTSATHFGKAQVKQVMNFVVSPLEIIAFICLLGILGNALIWIIPCLLLYIVYVYHRELIFVKEHFKEWSKEEKENYNFVGGVVLNEFYEKWLPMLFLFILCIKQPIYLILLLLHVVLFIYNLKDFSKDYLVIKNLFLVNVYWFLVHVFYYQSYLKFKHFVYWKVKRKSYDTVEEASWEVKKTLWKFREFIRKIVEFIYWNFIKYVKFKFWGNIKHFIYWKILKRTDEKR